jgi:hypothetical protein
MDFFGAEGENFVELKIKPCILNPVWIITKIEIIER